MSVRSLLGRVLTMLLQLILTCKVELATDSASWVVLVVGIARHGPGEHLV